MKEALEGVGDMNNTNNVTIAEISTKITIALTDRTPWWEKDGENNRRRKQLAEAMNLHGWELDGIPSILKHIYSMIETGTITARSTVNGLKPNSISQIAANTANWYVSSVDAKRIFSELTSVSDVKHAVDDELNFDNIIENEDKHQNEEPWIRFCKSQIDDIFQSRIAIGKPATKEYIAEELVGRCRAKYVTKRNKPVTKSNVIKVVLTDWKAPEIE